MPSAQVAAAESANMQAWQLRMETTLRALQADLGVIGKRDTQQAAALAVAVDKMRTEVQQLRQQTVACEAKVHRVQGATTHVQTPRAPCRC